MVTFKDRLGLWVVLGYLFLCFVLIVAGSGQPVQLPAGPREINWLKILQVISSTLIFIVPTALFCRYLRPERMVFLQLHTAPHFYFLVTAVICIIFAVPAVSFLESWNMGLHLPATFSSLEDWMRAKEAEAGALTEMFFEDHSTRGLIVNLLVMALVAALSEELFFRGLLQRMFVQNRMNPHVAIVLTAILFSAFHLQFFGFVPRLFLGIILGYLYHITQNLWVSIAAHFCNNAIAVLGAHYYSEEAANAQNGPGTETIGLSFALLSFVLVIGQLYFLQRFMNRVRMMPPNE